MPERAVNADIGQNPGVYGRFLIVQRKNPL